MIKIDSIQPTAGYVLVKISPKENKAAGGIILPDATQQAPQSGEVIAVGADYINEKGMKIPSPVLKGHKVIYKEWGGQNFKTNGEDKNTYQFYKFEDILGIIHE